MPLHVLIVEDDPGIRTSLRMALQDEGYQAEVAPDAETALQACAAHPRDVVLVDLMLPGMDGFELVRRLRRTSDSSILVVSARSDTHDIVAGLEAGADDYVTKPFEIKELTARLRAVRRRTSGPGPSPASTATVGDLVLDPGQGTVTLRGEPVHVTKTEFHLLHELAQASGRVLSREQLLDRVWAYDYFGDSRIVDVHVRRVRTKIEDDPSSPQRLLTVRGFGYKLVP